MFKEILLFSVFTFLSFTRCHLCATNSNTSFLDFNHFNRCICKNYTPKVQYWQFCPNLSEQSLADFCRSKNKNKTKMFGNFFSLGFWKNYNDTTSGTFVMGRPVLMQNTRQCGRTIIWHRFHVGNAPSKIHLS